VTDKNIIEWVFFDAGGTLLFLDPERVLTVLGVTQDGAAARLERAWYHAMLAFDERVLRGDQTDEGLWFWFWREMCRAAGFQPLSQQTAKSLLEENLRLNLWNRTTEEALRVTETLGPAAAGYRLGVISNSDGRIVQTLEGVGLGGRFEVIVDSGIVHVEKPDPKIFRLALEQAGPAFGGAGTRPERALLIGDSYTADYLGATAAGWHAVLLDPLGLHARRQARSVKNLTEFAATLHSPS
jgi:putative hydrolase of the HAD superfamily